MQEHVLGLAATLTKFLWKGRGTSCFHCGCFLLLFLFICCLLVGWTFFFWSDFPNASLRLPRWIHFEADSYLESC